MGVFDLRCCLSGLSVNGRSRPERFGSTMLLLEEVDGMYLPATPPVTGVYDGYGRIELWDRAEPEHAEWVGTMLELAWEAGLLTSSFPNGLEYCERLGDPAAVYLAHAADSVFNNFRLTIDGTRVVPCIYRADVGAAIASSTLSAPAADEQRLLEQLADDAATARYADWLDEQGRRIEAAFVRRSHAREKAGIFDQAPEASRPILDRFRRVLRYACAHRALRPFAVGETGQDDNEDLDRLAQEAWDGGDPIVHELLDRWERADSAARERELPFHETAKERALAAQPVMIEAVNHVLRRCAVADEGPITAAIRHSAAQERVLEMLRAPRSLRPAMLSRTDGIVSFRGATLLVTNAAYPDYPVELAIGDREVLVTDAARVTAGQPLTSGERDLHDVLMILGARAAMDELIAALALLLDLPREALQALVEPMFGHVAIEQTRQRVTAETFQRWYEAGLLERHRIHAAPVITSYATLASHVDPTFDEVLAEAQRLGEAPPRDDSAYRMTLRR